MPEFKKDTNSFMKKSSGFKMKYKKGGFPFKEANDEETIEQALAKIEANKKNAAEKDQATLVKMINADYENKKNKKQQSFKSTTI